MAALTQFTAGATLSAADLNDIIDHLQGGTGEDDAYHFRASSGNDFLVTLSDAAGARKFSVRDSAGAEVFAVDSDGNVTISGVLTQGTFLFPTGVTPTPTTEGSAEWDTDDNLLAVGDSSGTKIIIPTPTTTAGDMEYADGARSHARVAIGIAGQVLETNSGATAPAWANRNVGKAIQGFVEGGFGALYILGGSTNALINFADDDHVGVGLSVVEQGTATVTQADNSELSGGFDLFVTASGDDAGFLGTAGAAAADDWVVGCRVAQFGSAAGQEFFMGLHDVGVDFDGTNNGLIGWRLSDTGNYIGVSDNGGSESVVDSSNNDTSVHTLRMEISGGGATIEFFFDNVLIGAAITTNIPSSTALDLVCGVTGTDAADHHFYVSDFYAYRGN